MKFVLIGFSLVLLVMAVITGYFFTQYQKIKNNPEQVTKAENEALVEEVSKIYDLPKDETPTIATVIDKEKLKDQPFFANAQNGDKILIFTKAKKAIVYRPKEKVIVNAGPIALDQSALAQVALINSGGDIAGVEKKISESFGDIATVFNKSEAKNRNNIKKTIVVDVSGKNPEAAAKIAQGIGAEVSSLPAGETAPDGASIVIFVK